MPNEHKKEIINRLVKDGAIDFNEALELWETEKETVYVPYYVQPYQDVINPHYPMFANTFVVTCGTTTDVGNVVTSVVTTPKSTDIFSYTQN